MCSSLSLSDVSNFLAQVIGFYLIFMTCAMLFQPARFKKIMSDLMSHQASLFLCGSMNILFGIVVLVCHNVWAAEWYILITLIGWLTLLKGALILYAPEKYAKLSKHLLDKAGYKTWTLIWLLIAIYLAWMGIANA